MSYCFSDMIRYLTVTLGNVKIIQQLVQVYVYILVGILFIYIGDIYCFGTGLPISMAKDIYEYSHFK